LEKYSSYISEKIWRGLCLIFTMTANASDAVWQKLDSDLREYGDKVDLAKSQFEGLTDSINQFGKQLEEAQAREQKITEMLQSFMSKIDQVSEGNWQGSPSASRTVLARPASPLSQHSVRSNSPSDRSRLKLASLVNEGSSSPSSFHISADDTGSAARVHIHRTGSVTIDQGSNSN
jgi:hypothetical protein